MGGGAREPAMSSVAERARAALGALSIAPSSVKNVRTRGTEQGLTLKQANLTFGGPNGLVPYPRSEPIDVTDLPSRFSWPRRLDLRDLVLRARQTVVYLFDEDAYYLSQDRNAPSQFGAKVRRIKDVLAAKTDAQGVAFYRNGDAIVIAKVGRRDTSPLIERFKADEDEWWRMDDVVTTEDMGLGLPFEAQREDGDKFRATLPVIVTGDSVAGWTLTPDRASLATGRPRAYFIYTAVTYTTIAGTENDIGTLFDPEIVRRWRDPQTRSVSAAPSLFDIQDIREPRPQRRRGPSIPSVPRPEPEIEPEVERINEILTARDTHPAVRELWDLFEKVQLGIDGDFIDGLPDTPLKMAIESEHPIPYSKVVLDLGGFQISDYNGEAILQAVLETGGADRIVLLTLLANNGLFYSNSLLSYRFNYLPLLSAFIIKWNERDALTAVSLILVSTDERTAFGLVNAGLGSAANPFELSSGAMTRLLRDYGASSLPVPT